MSLHELLGSSIHLKLSIKEGHGFGFLKSPVVIVATINGIFLETEVVSPSPDPLFNIDLVWETDKKNLRSFRASNTPIKIECFTVSTNNQRKCIGSILLNIKSAQVITSTSLKNVVEKWHRLIGVPPEAKALQPEILLSLTIQEPNLLSQPVLENVGDPTLAKPSTSVNSSSMPQTLPAFQPLLDFKQGYIQLGPEKSCSEMFLLHLIVKRAFELEFLLSSQHKIQSIDYHTKPLQIAFSLMGQSIKTKGFGEENWEKVCNINEEVVLPIRSSLSTLNSYLQSNPCAGVCFLFSGQEVAASELHIRSLVPTNDALSFAREFGREFSIMQNCLLVSSSSGKVPSHGDIPPTVEVTAKLKLTGTGLSIASHNTILNPVLVANQVNTSSNNIPCQTIDEPFSRSESRESQETFIVTTQSGPVWVPVAPSMVQSHPPSVKNASVEELTNIQEAVASVETDVKLVSKLSPQTSKNIADICDETASQLSNISKNYLTIDSPSKNCGMSKPQDILMVNEQSFKELLPQGLQCKSPASSSQKQSITNSVIPLDPGAAYKVVEELEDWREKQQEIFLAELKIRERDHIARITEDLITQSKAKTSELDKRMDECKLLTESLSHAKQDLRDRIKICSTREQELIRAKAELELQYNQKFQELTLAARRLDEGVKLKVAEVKGKCAKLEEQVKDLESERQSLYGKLNQKAFTKNSSDSNSMCGMSHDQVSQLLVQVDQLEGKLKSSLQSKAYFKEQWGKAVREMNQAKLQFTHSGNKRCLENILGQEEKELQNDQKTLEKIRREIISLNP